MPKHPSVDARFYEFAARFREGCLGSDGSLFHPSEAVWTLDHLDRLHAVYVGGADEGEDDYWTKLGKQLAGQPAGVVDLMAEMQFVQTLGAGPVPIQAKTKTDQIERVIAAREPAREPPEEIREAAGILCWNPGQALHQHRYWQLAFLLEAARTFKRLPVEERGAALADSDVFLDFVSGLDVHSAQTMRNHLLHLVHPDAFEFITSDTHKAQIIKVFAEHAGDASDPVDERLRRVRAALEEEHGEGFDFYDPAVESKWKPAPVGPKATIWKIAPGEGARLWPEWKSGGFASIGWGKLGDLSGLSEEQWEQRYDAKRAEHGWTAGGPKQPWRLASRVKAGDLVLANRGKSEVLGVGRVTGDYYFDDEHDYGHRVPVEWFELEPFAVSQGNWTKTMLRVNNPLAARVRAMVEGGGDPPPPPDPDPASPDFPALAHDLCLDAAEVEGWAELLHHKKQLIFYGPPGTGKTFIARKLATAFAGDPTRVELVQFHPSYAYEDFIEGYRPRMSTKPGAPPFKLVEGPLKRLAGRALNDPDHTYVMVIDEINRGNLPSIFGELFFLLEYRDHLVNLQYGGGDGGAFALPKNLHFIGTMNTADRSIGLFDAALRRRFFFVPFYPDAGGMEGLLPRFFERHNVGPRWIAAALDEANRLLRDRLGRDLQVGPSHFLDADLTEQKIRWAWEHAVLPFLADHLEAGEAEAFELERLRQVVSPGVNAGAIASEPAQEEALA